MTSSVLVCTNGTQTRDLTIVSLALSSVALFCLLLIGTISMQAKIDQEKKKALSGLLSLLAVGCVLGVGIVNALIAFDKIGLSTKKTVNLNTTYLVKTNKVHAIKDLAITNMVLSFIAVIAGVYIISYSMKPFRMMYADDVFKALQVYVLLYAVVSVSLSGANMANFEKHPHAPKK